MLFTSFILWILQILSFSLVADETKNPIQMIQSILELFQFDQIDIGHIY